MRRRRLAGLASCLLALSVATGCPGTRFSHFPGFGPNGSSTSQPGGVLDPAYLDIG